MSLDDTITVVIPTSPIKKHPDTFIISSTIALIRVQLPNSKIVVMCDGVRKEQEYMENNYLQYKNKLKKLDFHNVKIVEFNKHKHQTGMIKEVLPTIDTPQLLFIEHDFPVAGYIPWEKITKIIDEKLVDLVRFSLESQLIPEHVHLFLDNKPKIIGGVPLIRVGQWSQRPHIARTSFYQRIVNDYIDDNITSFIEDTIHGYFGHNFVTHGEKAWNENKLSIYHPKGDISRCIHFDGREDSEKWV